MGQISNEMVAQIKAMKLRGDRNQDVAAWFGINQGRISEICGKNSDPQYAHVEAEKIDIPPPGPYDFGGGGIREIYRLIVDIRNHWEQDDLRQARVRFERIYRSLGRPSEVDMIDEIFAEQFYDDRGRVMPQFKE